MPSRGKRRKEEQYKRSLGKIIEQETRAQEYNLATVTDVELSSDLRYAKVYVALPGSKEEKESTIQKFNEDVGFFRTNLAHDVNPKYTPELEFFLDDRTDKIRHIDEIVSEEKSEEAT